MEEDMDAVTALFMTGKGGGGHLAAAQALQSCVLDNEDSIIECVELVDAGGLAELAVSEALPSGDDIYNYFMQIGYYTAAGMLGQVASWGVKWNQAAIEEVFEEYWCVKRPAIVVSFVPFLNAAMRASLQRVMPSCRFLTVVTDFAHCREHPWLEPYEKSCGQFLVLGTELLRKQALQLGWPEHQLLRSSGMVIHPSFYERLEKPLKTAKPKLLVAFGGYAPSRVAQIAWKCAETHPEVDLIIICGKNQELYVQLQDFLEVADGRHVVEGFISSEKVRDYMRQAICVLGKAGPGVCAEACACQVPLAVLQWLQESCCGLVVDSLEQLPADLAEQAAACRQALTKLPPNDAVFEVADFLQQLMSEPGPEPVHVNADARD
ncbi:unnamed protein product [Effrenium voratum]|uniref:Glycosyl transferase family 28 C-terminal domain-containing protein n=1 Tax=Effrenium voratum TaxID=2562239 RepID=A0AA36MSW5_9DINO|nr:unnamed protein product [Effrenium voratum]